MTTESRNHFTSFDIPRLIVQCTGTRCSASLGPSFFYSVNGPSACLELRNGTATRPRSQVEFPPPDGNGCARLGAFDFPQEHKSSCVAGFLFKKILSFWTNFLFLYCLKSPSPSPVSPRLWILSYSTANLGVFTATTGDKEDSKTLWQVWYSYFCWKEECRYSVDRQLGV